MQKLKEKKKSCDLNPPIEARISYNNLDSGGGFKSHDLLQFLHANFGSSKAT